MYVFMHVHMYVAIHINLSYTEFRLEPIMPLKLPIMLLSSSPKSSLLCSEIKIMLIGTVKFNTLKLYST